MSKFIHLHNHSHYSILDATPTINELVSAAVENNQSAIALTDHGVMFGTIEFYEACKKANIKPIIGCEVYIANGSRFDKDAGKERTKRKNYFHLLLLAKNQIGYKNLMHLSSIGHTEGFYYRPRIDKEVLQEYSEGLICTSACLGGIVAQNLITGDYSQAKQEAEFYQSIFGEDFYLEIQDHLYDEDKIILRDVPRLAKEIGAKIVATNDIHYLKKEDAIAHNVLLNIKDAKGKVEIDIRDLRYKTPEFYFKTPEEMEKLFIDFPEAIESTVEIADKCNLELELNKLYMPVFPIPSTSKAKDLGEYLRELVQEGLEKKYHTITQEIQDRANYELDVIIKMDFPGYFLIVWDFIRAAKELGVTVGPGRGSAAGSIVAYALDITKIDPLKYNLLFERFLNPERVSMPDIDIDFNDETRDRVIGYVKNKYGENAVAQIITFGTLASRAVIKDVGRVLGIDLDTVSKINKEFETNFGRVESIDEAMKKSTLQWVKDDPKLEELLEYAQILEDKNRNTGTHAAGVVIAPGDIANYVPLYRPEKSSKTQSLEIVTQYEMSCLEKTGLVKMDFLGLTTLSVIERTLAMIQENTGKIIDLEEIDYDDQKTFELISQGNTHSVFQFESSGMQEYLRQLKPHNLEELAAMNALYRPGPMDNIPTFINRKHGREPITYLHPIMEKSLKNTYGIIVYQEQVMQLARDLAGFSLGEADVMRRAMGKKKQEEMEKLKPKFSNGCLKNDIPQKLAEEIFDLIAKFANYGFNKSHSMAYSYLAFQTAWLKTYYPAEFLASSMTAFMLKLDKLVPIINHSRKTGIKVLPPDINISVTNFVARDGKIFFGLAGVKNVGIPAVENIVEVRKEGDFTSIFDFAKRVDTRLVTKRTLEALVATGAFDSIHGIDKRASLFASVDLALDYAKTINSPSENLMDNIFQDIEDVQIYKDPELIFVPEWTKNERISKEKEFVNFYMSGHPLDDYYTPINSLNTVTLEKDDEKDINTYGLISGLITGIRVREDKRKNKIAFVTIENYTGSAELAFWSEAYASYNELLTQDNIICCEGKIVKEEGETAKMNVEVANTIENAINKYCSGYLIHIHDNEESEKKLLKLKEETKKYDNPLRLYFYLRDENNYIYKYATNNVNLSLDMDTIKTVALIFDEENIALLTAIPVAPENGRKRWRK